MSIRHTQYVSKFEKLSSGRRTGKSQFSFQSRRKAIPKNAQTTTQLHLSHMLVKECSKFSKSGFKPYVNCEFPDVQAGFRKGRGTRDKIVNISWIIEKAREFQKNIYFCFIDYTKPLTSWTTTNWKILQKMGISDHLTCLFRILYTGQEATVRTGHGMTDWFQIGRGVCQGCILSPCSFNLYAEYIIRNAGLEEAQPWIKIAGRNINNLRLADDTTLMAESEEELKSLLIKVKEESEKVGLKLNIQKLKIRASFLITS